MTCILSPIWAVGCLLHFQEVFLFLPYCSPQSQKFSYWFSLPFRLLSILLNAFTKGTSLRIVRGLKNKLYPIRLLHQTFNWLVCLSRRWKALVFLVWKTFHSSPQFLQCYKHACLLLTYVVKRNLMYSACNENNLVVSYYFSYYH